MSMVPSIKAEWVAALESGDYEQGRGNLATVDTVTVGDLTTEVVKWCCLGVLCDLAVKAGVIHSVQAFGRLNYAGEGSVLPQAVSYWAGLEGEDNPGVGEGKKPLSVWNDGSYYGKEHENVPSHSFEEIAAAIRDSDL